MIIIKEEIAIHDNQPAKTKNILKISGYQEIDQYMMTGKFLAMMVTLISGPT
jgi:hypothetical protein